MTPSRHCPFRWNKTRECEKLYKHHADTAYICARLIVYQAAKLYESVRQ